MTDTQMPGQHAEVGNAEVEKRAEFSKMVACHRPWVYSTALRLVNDPHTAEDVTQAVFIVLSRKAAKLAGHPNLNGWLLKAVRHQAAHALRATIRRTRRERAAAFIRWQWASGSSQTDGLDQLLSVLDEQVARLRSTDRQAILLRFYQDKKIDEVAAQLGISAPAARKRIERALALLRDRLRDRTGRSIPVVPFYAWLSQTTRSAPFPIESTSVPQAFMNFKPIWITLGTGFVALTVIIAVVATRPTTMPQAAATAPVPPVGAISQKAAAPDPVVDLTGIVSSPDGIPVSNATVTVFPLDFDDGVPAPDEMRPTARTDAKGIFHIPPIRKNWGGFLIAQADGFGVASSGILTIGQPKLLNLTLARSSDLTVTFQRPDGKPATGLEVYLVGAYWFNHPEPQPLAVCPGGQDKRLFQSTTDTDGSCTFKGLPRGSDIWLGVRDDRYAQLLIDQQSISLPEDQPTVTAAITLTPAASISGRVTFGPTGKPLAGAGVQAFTSDGHQQVGPVYTAADGTYTITQLKGGEFTVELRDNLGSWHLQQLSKEWTSYAVPNVKTDPGQHIDGCNLKLIHGTLLTGRVVDQDDNPVPDISLGSLSDPSHGNDSGQAVKTDASGNFTFRIPPGRATIILRAPLPAGWTEPNPSRQTVTVTDGNNPPIEFRLTRNN